jgi:hypothetical protein
MSESAEQVILRARSLWNDEGILRSTPLAHEGGIDRFFRRFDVRVPEGFLLYLRFTNGTTSMDRHGITFMAPDEVEPLSSIREFAHLVDANKYFVFADYLAWSHGYAVFLDRDASPSSGSVHLIAGNDPVLISHSFEDWMRLYVDGSAKLFPTGKVD